MGDAPVPELEAVLDGGAWDVGTVFEGSPAPPGPVRLGRNVCYVVLAVIFNQELPVGSGIPMTGGTLKTLEAADAESLQATWWPGDPRSLPLRSPDILPVLDLAARYRRSPAHPPTLPRELPCSALCLRLLLPFANAAGRLWLLLATSGTPHLPVVACDASPSPSRLRSGLRPARAAPAAELLAWEAQPEALGLLGLQHRAGRCGDTDGICFNVMLSVPAGSQRDEPPEPRHPALRWWPVRDEGCGAASCRG
ncbi:hypothetical protein DUI87_32537 [Hirundo rustica rustica]|uniref:Uncharacterized protein n=1 Tax=Hirundo rustica rustica TaxID=333673 RepID=A0A3M0IWL7_HIRRU|nr:hypothetical protein DUI87_32537 [Hirundo rustica rustica]